MVVGRNFSPGRLLRRGRYPVSKACMYVCLVVVLLSFLNTPGTNEFENGLVQTITHSSAHAANPSQHRRLGGALAHGLFGAANYCPPLVGAVSMIIVVACVIATEGIFEALNHMTHDTPFAELILAIENEMMIVGFMAFLLKIILNVTTIIDSTWLLALEYADLLVPIITFIRCFLGIGLIYMSIAICRSWGKAYHFHHMEIMDSYLDKANTFWSKGYMSWIPLSTINSQMEFRIFHHIFCEQFMIQRSEFAFDEYVHRIFEKFLLRIIGMHEIDWFLICIMTLLNWMRIDLKLDIADCTRGKKVATYCSSYYDCTCHRNASMVDFIIVGGAIFAFTLFLAFLSRTYELRLMASRGVHSADDYALFLDQSEKEAQTQKKSDRKRFNSETLKVAISKVKEKLEAAKAEEENNLYSIVGDFVHVVTTTCLCPGCLMGSKSFHVCGKKPSHTSSKIAIVEEFNELDEEEDKGWPGKPPAPTSGLSRQATMRDGKAGAAASAPAPPAKTIGSILYRGASVAGKQLESFSSSLILTRTSEAALDQGEDLSRIFLFKNPALYFDAVAITMMPISFYLALWITNFVDVAAYMDNTVGWQIASIAPGIAAAICYMYSVRVASLLQAVTQIDHDAVEEILEQTEGAKHLQQEMREKILAKLEEIGDPRLELNNLFRSIDDNGSGLLSRNEFQLFLNELNITFSRRKWAQIYAEIDRDNSDEIDYDELFLFIFPDSNEAKRMEYKRIRNIEKRVSRKVEIMRNKISLKPPSRRSSSNIITLDVISQSTKRSSSQIASLSLDSNDAEHGVGNLSPKSRLGSMDSDDDNAMIGALDTIGESDSIASSWNQAK